MIRKLFLVIGVGISTAVAGLASIANAQSVNSPNTGQGVTIEGDSLRQIENRSIGGDFQTFFNGASQGGQYPSRTNVGRITQSPSTAPLGENIQVLFDDTLRSDTPFSFPNSGDTNDSKQVKVQFR
jgi:hypothetical protein